MKKIKSFIAKKSIPNWIPIVVLAICILGAFTGWKITYNPKLENSWNAIAAIGGWVSAIISGIAIWFAVAIPKRIADEQNKISLFEKRFVCYLTLLKYLSFSKSIRSANSSSQLKTTFLFTFTQMDENFKPTDIVLMVKKDENVLMSGLFLFPSYCEGKMIREILEGLLSVASLISSTKSSFSPQQKDKINFFCDICDKFENLYMESIRKELNIGI